MTLHIIKLCVGVDSIDQLAKWQQARLAQNQRLHGVGEIWHTTRMTPKRQPEVLDGGSLYWVIKGLVMVRQRIVGFDDGAKEDGTPCCLIKFDPELVPVRPVPRKPFQGWRYLTAEDAPDDLNPGAVQDDVARMPARMRRELAELGLL
ncbi:MAG: DUF1489 domain-containing protein [Pseudomonadota bacterium]